MNSIMGGGTSNQGKKSQIEKNNKIKTRA